MRTTPMERALQAWLHAASQDNDELNALRAAARAVAANPWDVVQSAGALSRARTEQAKEDMGLTASLRPCGVDSPRAMVQIPEGAPYPHFDRQGRQQRGAFDTPKSLARQLVQETLKAGRRSPKTGLDPACGPGAFLLALREAGVQQILGTDLDPKAVAVAQIAVPEGQIQVADGMQPGPVVDIVVGNPPYVPPERQSSESRAALRQRYPWLSRRFDLAVPFAAAASERVHAQGGLGLILPSSILVQPYGAPLRRTWLTEHRIAWLSSLQVFPEVSVQVAAIVIQVGGKPQPLPGSGITPSELLTIEQAPLALFLRSGDPQLVQRIRSKSIELGTLCEVDTGVVSHGPQGGKAERIWDIPGDGRLPYVDAKDLHQNRVRWLDYQPKLMHRPKRIGLFSDPKLLIQRLRGSGPIHAWLDESGLIAGHTLTVVKPDQSAPPLHRLLELVQSPLVDALVRIERGSRLDLYPKDVASIPVPKDWLDNPHIELQKAWGLTQDETVRLESLAKELHQRNKPKIAKPS